MHSEGFFKKLFKAVAKTVVGMAKHVGSTVAAVAKGDIGAIAQLSPTALKAKAAGMLLENVAGALPPPMNQAASMAGGIANAKADMVGGGGLKMAMASGGLPGMSGMPIPGMPMQGMVGTQQPSPPPYPMQQQQSSYPMQQQMQPSPLYQTRPQFPPPPYPIQQQSPYPMQSPSPYQTRPQFGAYPMGAQFQPSPYQFQPPSYQAAI